MPGPDSRSASRALTLLNPRLRYHRASVANVERIPATGAAMIVSNHGRLDLDSFILLRLLLRDRGRLARLMADHLWFGIPFVRDIFKRAGAVDGTRDNALDVLHSGELVLTYPGGVREIFGGRFAHEHLDWEGRTGFARVALQAAVPVVPVAGVGVNSGLVFVTRGRLLGALLFRGLLRRGPDYGEYRNPLALGVVPFPLPFSLAVAAPLPCRVTYHVGEPVQRPSGRPASLMTSWRSGLRARSQRHCPSCFVGTGVWHEHLTSASSGRRERYPDVSAGAPLMRNTLGRAGGQA
jgi:1-acyl-sn-glycerol-3-phosphate acyltransferase